MNPRLKQIERVGSNGQILSWNASSGVWAPRDYLFGDEFDYAESIGTSSTSSETWQQKLRLTTATLPAGTYLISWTYARGGSGVGWPQQRIQVDDTTEIHFAYSGRHDVSSNRNIHYGCAAVALSNASHTIDFDYRHLDGGGSGYVSDVRLMIWRILPSWTPPGSVGTPGPVRPKQFAQDSASVGQIIGRGSAIWQPTSRKVFGSEYQEDDSLGVSTTNSTSWQQKLRLATTSLPAGDYLIKVSYRFSNEDDSDYTDIRLQLDDTTTLWEVESSTGALSNTQGYYRSGGAIDLVTLTSGTHNFDLDYRTTSSSDTAYIADVRMSLWRES